MKELIAISIVSFILMMHSIYSNNSALFVINGINLGISLWLINDKRNRK